MRKTLSGLQGVVSAHDDILVFGKNKTELEKNVRNVLLRLESAGLTLNIKKFKFNRERIYFFGLTFSKDGINRKEVKTEALRNAERPNNASELHSFLGLAVWCFKFMKNFATVSVSLWDLFKKGRDLAFTTKRLNESALHP